MTRTIGIDNRKYSIAEAEVNVTPGINTVNSANSVGSTKKLERLFNRNQNANPIIRNPAITLTSAKTLIPRLVLVSIFESADCTL
jgi:hypothetical protein